MRRATADPVKARTRQMHATLKRRAGGQEVMSLEEFREFYQREYGSFLRCPYCGVLLNARNVALDHKRPVARGGTHGADNLHFICQPCNKAKGQMSHGEFCALLEALNEIGRAQRNARFRDDVLTTLKVGNSFRIGAQRRAKQ